MKFFHVYNEEYFNGLVKNNLINKNTGFKIQHVFSLADDMKFNRLAAKGGKLYQLLKEGNYPFYVDRIAGGATYHSYDFDSNLIEAYNDLLGDWFLGFQLHESGSNIRMSDWNNIIKLTGKKGPYDPKVLRRLLEMPNVTMPDGTVLAGLSQGTPEEYADMRYAETAAEYIEEMKKMFQKRMKETAGKILPCDSYYLAAKLQDDLGMNSFMPEVGCQMTLMRQAVSLVRGMAKAKGKTWGAYYECWREIRENGNAYYTMPCYNSDPSNEWSLAQDLHPDDFTSYGENGGSSRLLQNRIYHYAFMSGADYFSEEWGLNCSYTDMHTFDLSDYGKIKKDFIDFTEGIEDVSAVIPFAIVLPNSYSCVEIPDMFEEYKMGVRRDKYLNSPLTAEERAYYGHIEDVLKLFFARSEQDIYGNEGHVITNTRFGDVFDIIYEDASDEALQKYEYLIDATENGDFASKKSHSGLKILESDDLEKLSAEVLELIPKVMPCFADSLCWLVSSDKSGRRYLTILNNEGNERSLEKGDIILKEADRRVKITFNSSVEPKLIKSGAGRVDVEKTDDFVYCANIPAAGFAIFEF